jgi:hypothetical protein
MQNKSHVRERQAKKAWSFSKNQPFLSERWKRKCHSINGRRVFGCLDIARQFLNARVMKAVPTVHEIAWRSDDLLDFKQFSKRFRI